MKKFIATILLSLCSLLASAQLVPLNDLGTGYYLGQFQGGLYPGGSNVPPASLDADLRAIAAQVQPVNGKYAFDSLGFSNVDAESANFFGFAKQQKTPAINKTSQVLVDGAIGSTSACDWTYAFGPSNCHDGTTTQNLYDWDLANRLTPAGVAENQVEVIWMKQADVQPALSSPSLPASNADAYTLESNMGKIARAAKQRYVNLQLMFISSRIYGGYCTANTCRSPEPYAYEYGFSVKWLIAAQIAQCPNTSFPYCTGPVDPVAGDLNFDGNNSSCAGACAALLSWGPYLWADGANPRSDGLIYCDGTDDTPGPPCNGLEDYQADDTHPGNALPTQNFGVMKIVNQLWSFFSTSPYSTAWFLAH